MSGLLSGDKTYQNWVAYEVVWADTDGRLYIWTFNYTGERLSPVVLPDEVNKVTDFVCGQGIPNMVYMMPRFIGDSNDEAMCSHSNAQVMKDTGFGDSREWLKGRGLVERKWTSEAKASTRRTR